MHVLQKHTNHSMYSFLLFSVSEYCLWVYFWKLQKLNMNLHTGSAVNAVLLLKCSTMQSSRCILSVLMAVILLMNAVTDNIHPRMSTLPYTSTTPTTSTVLSAMMKEELDGSHKIHEITFCDIVCFYSICLSYFYFYFLSLYVLLFSSYLQK